MKTLILAAMMLLLMATGVSGAAAQDDEFSLENFEGLESGYARYYSSRGVPMTAAPSSAGPATASAEESTPEGEVDATVSVEIVTFDSEENAKAFLDGFRAESDRQLSEAPEREMEVADLEDIENDGFLVKVMPGAEGDSTAIFVFQDGETIWSINVRAADIDSATTLGNEYLNFVLDQETEEDEVTFNADGTSTGGVFDRMPGEGDEIPAGLTVVEDYSFSE